MWRDDGLHASGWCNDRGALLPSLQPKKRSDDSCASGQYGLNRLNHPSGKHEEDREHEQIGACFLQICSRDCVNGPCMFLCPYPIPERVSERSIPHKHCVNCVWSGAIGLVWISREYAGHPGSQRRNYHQQARRVKRGENPICHAVPVLPVSLSSPLGVFPIAADRPVCHPSGMSASSQRSHRSSRVLT